MKDPYLLPVVEHVGKGLSLRAALRAAHLPQSLRPRLTRLLNDLNVPYKHKGKGQRDHTHRLQVLARMGPPEKGGRGYWTLFAKDVSELEGQRVTAETIQLWYGRHYGNAYVYRKHPAGPSA